jgi:2-keto-3-deoxy-L-rhamnonate aldolase RhmA
VGLTRKLSTAYPSHILHISFMVRLALPAITPLLGVLPPSPTCSSTLSILGSLNFDFLFIDLEHNPVDPSSLPNIIRLCKTMNTPSLVRQPYSTENYQRIMDAGGKMVEGE